MEQKPVYVINGFLDSGKTDFFRYTMQQNYFRTNGKTLLIVTEEGENEYEEELLKKTNTVMEIIDEEEEFTVWNLQKLDKKHKPVRILIEYNGMWDFKNFQIPAEWTLTQEITMVNAQTFELYYTNMRSLLGEQVRNTEMIIFNRCDGLEDKLPGFKRNLKAINRNADILFENEDGEVDVTIDEDLPYDLSQDPIELNNYGFGMFYIDSFDHPERYEGKRVRFTGRVLKPKGFPAGYFVPGRMAMTCCANDMQFLGVACQYDGVDDLKEKDWVEVTAGVKKEFFSEYEREGPVLTATSVVKTDEPSKPVIDFQPGEEV